MQINFSRMINCKVACHFESDAYIRRVVEKTKCEKVIVPVM